MEQGIQSEFKKVWRAIRCKVACSLFANLPTYASNAAAIAGGLTNGELYKNGTDITGNYLVCVVVE